MPPGNRAGEGLVGDGREPLGGGRRTNGCRDGKSSVVIRDEVASQNSG